jgi:hypothetical protein
MPRRSTKKERGVFEKDPGSEIWWIRYYIDGRERREKVGRKTDSSFFHLATVFGLVPGHLASELILSQLCCIVRHALEGGSPLSLWHFGEDLSHNASFSRSEKYAPSNAGTKHLVNPGCSYRWRIACEFSAGLLAQCRLLFR